MAVPPLHECVLNTRVDGPALDEAFRGGRVACQDLAQCVGEGEVVEDVEDGDCDDAGDVEPERDVHVAFAAFDERHEEVGAEEAQPDDGDHEVDGPFEFCVFLALGDAQRKRQCGAHDDQLPAPEVEPAQLVAPHASLAQALGAVVDGCEYSVAREGEDHGVGVERADATEVEPTGFVEEGEGL